jgi:nucleoside-diphosphate-sugar epimerase
LVVSRGFSKGLPTERLVGSVAASTSLGALIDDFPDQPQSNSQLNMRVLVTGGAGFIGSHLARRLVVEGYDVTVLDNFSTGRRQNLEGADTTVVEGDIRDLALLPLAMRGVEAVFHVAALTSVARSWEDPVTSLHVNALGTSNVIEAAVHSGVRTLVYSSSASVYGNQAAGKQSEDLPPNPISPYGYAKLMGEKLTLAHAHSSQGIRAVVLRYFNVFGAGQDPDSPYSAVIPLFIKHALGDTTATIYGDGKQSRDFVHVDNVVDANLCALQSGISGVAMNIASGQSHTLLELVEGISVLNNRRLETAFGAPREGDIRHSLADISLAAAKIGYRPKVTFMDGLRRTFDEYGTA